MPWDCQQCHVTVALDSEDCPSCSAPKTTWTVVAERTRSFKVTRAKFEVLLERAGELVPAESIPALRTSDLGAMQAWGLIPRAQVVRLRLRPKGRTDRAIGLEVVYEAQPSAELEFEPDVPASLADEGFFDVRFLFAWGPGSAEALAFPGIEVVDLSEESADGLAPNLEWTVFGKSRELPTEAIEGSLRLRFRASTPAAGATEGEAFEVAGPLIGSAESESRDWYSYDAYSAQPLRTIWDVHQDADQDCGLTAATFVRLGGRRVANDAEPPRDPEGKTLTGAYVQNLATKMRTEAGGASDPHQGIHETALLRVLNEFAGVYPDLDDESLNRRWVWNAEPIEVPYAGRNKIVPDLFNDRMVSEFAGLMQALLDRSPRGVVLTMHNGYGPHAIVCLGIDVETMWFFDPGPTYVGSAQQRHVSTREMLARHSAASEALPTRERPRAITHLFYEQPMSDEHVLNIYEGTPLCELDDGAWAFNSEKTVRTTSPARWFLSAGSADAAARARAEAGTNAMVIEHPEGNFAVVDVEAVDASIAKKGQLDEEDSPDGSYFMRFHAKTDTSLPIGSVVVFLNGGGRVHERTLKMPPAPKGCAGNSHRD